MISFTDWDTKNKKKKGYTLTKSSSGLPLFVLDDPLQKDDGYYCLFVTFSTSQVEEV